MDHSRMYFTPIRFGILSLGPIKVWPAYTNHACFQAAREARSDTQRFQGNNSKMSRIPRLEQLSHEVSKSVDNSSSHNHTEEGTPGLSEAERNFKTVFYCSLFILGSLGNIMVIVVVKGKRKRTINDYFILNLAVSDLTFLWFSLPFYTYELFQSFYKNVFYCKIIWPMMSVTLSVSVFTLTSMGVERCRGIINPLQPRIKIQATLVWLLLIWIGAFVTMFPLMIVAQPDLTRPQSSSYNTRQRKSCARGRGAGDDHLALPFSVPISPCVLLARCMKTTGDESAAG